MSQSHHDDPLIQALSRLPRVEPDAAHADALRDRCRMALEHPPQPMNVTLEPAAVGTACAIYMWAVVRAVIR